VNIFQRESFFLEGRGFGEKRELTLCHAEMPEERGKSKKQKKKTSKKGFEKNRLI